MRDVTRRDEASVLQRDAICVRMISLRHMMSWLRGDMSHARHIVSTSFPEGKRYIVSVVSRLECPIGSFGFSGVECLSPGLRLARPVGSA